MGEARIRNARKEDCEAIADIYNYYVENTDISFEETKVSREEIEKRLLNITKEYPWIVYEKDGVIRGYAYLSKWKDRSAYRFTAETTIYVRSDEMGRGIGSLLLGRLMETVRSTKIHVLMAVIALPNEKSVRVHEKYGFRKVAHFTEVGFKHGKWIDVGYWELGLQD
jgi:phosphinothricin acetyltransferase